MAAAGVEHRLRGFSGSIYCILIILVVASTCRVTSSHVDQGNLLKGIWVLTTGRVLLDLWCTAMLNRKEHEKLLFVRSLKFIFSEKATKFCEISTSYLTGST